MRNTPSVAGCAGVGVVIPSNKLVVAVGTAEPPVHATVTIAVATAAMTWCRPIGRWVLRSVSHRCIRGECTRIGAPGAVVGQTAPMSDESSAAPPTDLLYLRDAYLRTFSATVSAVDGDRVTLDATAFYVTGGGQPHDTGSISHARGAARVTDVRKDATGVWHVLDGDLPAVGDVVDAVIDWERRHALMRTHTALHVLCGVIWNAFRVPVTGGNMEPLAARMDFEFDPLPDGFAATIEELVNAELVADRVIEVDFLPRGVAVGDEDLIRTKVNMIPDGVTEIRVVDIVGLDRQADGGTHVRSTAEVGHFRVVKTESKGKGNKRLRIELD